MSNIGTNAIGTILQGQGVGVAAKYSTASYPSTAGSSGKILISDGANIISSTPTFPNASATSRKIIVSDGTNWEASTETYAVPGTSGNVLTSDGTNWTSTAPSGVLSTVSGALTNAQIKALHATPIQIVAAPGVGKILVPVMLSITMTYGGTNVFVAGAGQTIALYYGTALSVCLGLANTSITAAYSSYCTNAGSMFAGAGFSSVTNAALNLYSSSATEITGNAAGDNTIAYNLLYRTITIP